jgi:hypothetical protein
MLRKLSTLISRMPVMRVQDKSTSRKQDINYLKVRKFEIFGQDINK